MIEDLDKELNRRKNNGGVLHCDPCLVGSAYWHAFFIRECPLRSPFSSQPPNLRVFASFI